MRPGGPTAPEWLPRVAEPRRSRAVATRPHSRSRVGCEKRKCSSRSSQRDVRFGLALIPGERRLRAEANGNVVRLQEPPDGSWQVSRFVDVAPVNVTNERGVRQRHARSPRPPPSTRRRPRSPDASRGSRVSSESRPRGSQPSYCAIRSPAESTVRGKRTTLARHGSHHRCRGWRKRRRGARGATPGSAGRRGWRRRPRACSEPDRPRLSERYATKCPRLPDPASCSWRAREALNVNFRLTRLGVRNSNSLGYLGRKPGRPGSAVPRRRSTVEVTLRPRVSSTSHLLRLWGAPARSVSVNAHIRAVRRGRAPAAAMAAALRAAPVSVLLELHPDGIWCGRTRLRIADTDLSDLHRSAKLMRRG